ncbi:hypothetical protein CSO23_004471 [Salmonella enterica subsp. diarizonae]|nr:hypothetical protein [Salmonella enterica subsp. diarizonae]
MIKFQPQPKNYTFYYDESNNVRKLYLSKIIDGYNIDHDPNKHNSVNFVLAGVAHQNTCSTADFSNLRKRIQLQPNATEFKLKHLAKGSFLSMLTSKKLTGFLEWLLDCDLYLHYFNLNMEYWGVVDIIDDCIMFGLDKGILKKIPDKYLYIYALAIKDALHTYVKDNKIEYIKFLKSFDFPYIEGRERKFIQGLVSLISDHCVELSRKQADGKQVELAQSLLQLLMACSEAKIDDLTLAMYLPNQERTNEDNIIVDGFSVFYQTRAQQFSQSKHVFDVEKVVEADLEELKKISPQIAALNYSFADSKTNVLIQVSDVVAGLMQHYFDFINNTTHKEIIHLRSNLNEKQLINIHLIQALINKSDKENEVMLHYVMSALEHEKHRDFMYPNV